MLIVATFTFSLAFFCSQQLNLTEELAHSIITLYDISVLHALNSNLACLLTAPPSELLLLKLLKELLAYQWVAWTELLLKLLEIIF